MTILGWQLNTQSDANFHFVLGYQTVNFRILVVPFNKAVFVGFFGVFLLLQILDILQYLPHIFTS
jgi:hypothetical protein